jgi:thioredoxin reductase (NADPH)
MRASEVLQHDLKEHSDKITVHMNTTTDEIIGKDGLVVSVTGTDKTSGKKVTFDTDGVFVFIGLLPNTQFLKDTSIKLDEVGMIVTDGQLGTSVPGVFAAGDVRSGATMQIASATGEGASAALVMRKYIEEHSTKAQPAATV